MQMSAETDKIFPAFVKMQAALGNASKDKAGHGYKYADLAQCIDTAKRPLAENGLAVSQLLGQSEHGTTLITMLVHESGQFFRSEFVMEKAVLMGGASKNPAQVMGSSITYMKRYSYTSILGMAQADDDAAMVGDSYNNQQRQRPVQPPQQQQPEPVINPQQVKSLQGAIMAAGIDEQQFCKIAHIGAIGQLTVSRLEGAINMLKSRAMNTQAA